MLQQTNGKLRSYITFKFNFDREKYLSVLICSKIVWTEPYQEVVLDLKSVLDVIYASWRIGNVESKVSNGCQ
jgi:hypothetical protein